MNSIKTQIQIIIILLAGLALSGCTSMRAIESTISLAEQVSVGDHLVVYEKSGRVVDMTVRVIDTDKLSGTLGTEGGAPVDVLLADIEKIEVEKIDGAKTTLAVVGVTVVAVPVVFLAAFTGALAGY